jgi:gluconate 2-dehydrogenase gamma chain
LFDVSFLHPSTLNHQLAFITLIGRFTGKKRGLTGFWNREQIESALKSFTAAKPMTRRFFLRVSSATLLAAPLFPPLPVLAGTSWRFLNETESATVVALCERIIPADADPGATWAGVVQFIDRKLAGYYHRYQQLYQLGLRGIHQSSLALYGKPFVELSAVQQDELLHKLEANQAPGDIWKQVSAAEFFDRLVDHTMQGFYGGPRHGGNRDAVSWHMLNLPTAPVRSRRPLTAPWSPNPNVPSV